ncbi:MAG: hypothetical protein DME55_13150 [Verrucomicrobia bacterium]|nr:MAG: hypothetical protein DME55_13150 [Verrucomicrobiota bacterium]
MLNRESAVRRDMFIELGSINQSKLRRSAMETSRLFMPLLTELGGLRDGFCYRLVTPSGALKSALPAVLQRCRRALRWPTLFNRARRLLAIGENLRANSRGKVEERAA